MSLFSLSFPSTTLIPHPNRFNQQVAATPVFMPEPSGFDPPAWISIRQMNMIPLAGYFQNVDRNVTTENERFSDSPI